MSDDRTFFLKENKRTSTSFIGLSTGGGVISITIFVASHCIADFIVTPDEALRFAADLSRRALECSHEIKAARAEKKVEE